MHLVQTQSLNAGVPIGKPSLPLDYIPFPFDKYITIQPFTKPSKTYDYWQDVIDIVSPYLENAGIKIVQIGGPNEIALNKCISYQGNATIPQSNYLINSSLLHVGVDSWAAHAAGVLGKKIICLYSNNKVNNVKPFWGDDEDHILIDCVPSGQNPSYAYEEREKIINSVMPEEVAGHILNLLNIEYNSFDKTINIGPLYNHRFVEWIPVKNVNNQQIGVEALIARVDFNYDLSVLENQLKICKLNIIIDKEIPLELLKRHRNNISEFIYLITHNNNPEFAFSVQKLGINVKLMSYLSESEIQQYKLKYCDIGIIHTKEPKIITGASRFKTNKVITDGINFYPSFEHFKRKIPLAGINQVFDTNLFWRESEFFYFYA